LALLKELEETVTAVNAVDLVLKTLLLKRLMVLCQENAPVGVAAVMGSALHAEVKVRSK
jgi:hypothetical protein